MEFVIWDLNLSCIPTKRFMQKSGLPQWMFVRQDYHSGCHIVGVPSLLPPRSILQNSGKKLVLSVLPPVLALEVSMGAIILLWIAVAIADWKIKLGLQQSQMSHYSWTQLQILIYKFMTILHLDPKKNSCQACKLDISGFRLTLNLKTISKLSYTNELFIPFWFFILRWVWPTKIRKCLFTFFNSLACLAL